MDSSDQNRKLAEEIRKRQAAWDEAAKAMTENISQTQSRRGIAWKIFLLFGLICTVYFISSAFTDRTSFKEGVVILLKGATQFSIVLVAAWYGSSIYLKASEERKRKLEKIGIVILVGLVLFLAVYFRLVIGFVFQIDNQNSTVRSFFTNKRFILTLGIELMAAVFLYRVRKRMDLDATGARMTAYIVEGLTIYAVLTFFLQLIFQFDMPAIIFTAVTNLKIFLLFFFPLAAYVLIRKISSVV